MPDTFLQVWRSIRLECPLATAFLAQQWVKDAYRRLTDTKTWSFLRAETEIVVNDQKTGAVGVTQGLATVTGGTLAFAAADLGRQFRVLGGNIYSVIAVAPPNGTLDRGFTGATSGAASALIFDGYVTMPADFRSILCIYDPDNNIQLQHWITEEQLNMWDPERTSVGTPHTFVSRRLASGLAAIEGRVQYELWPYSAGRKAYPMLYYTAPADLTDSYVFRGPLANRGDILRYGALAAAARWPGTEDRKNPFFSIMVSQHYEQLFRAELDRLQVIDEDIYPTWLERVSWIQPPREPFDAAYAQSHDWSSW